MTMFVQKPPNTSKTLALVAYPGVQHAAIAGLQDMFSLLPRLTEDNAPIARVDIRTVSFHRDDIPADAFVFPPSLGPSQATPDHPLTVWARDQHRAGAVACSVCAGAFWLGAAGLLDGRPVTTHWALEEQFRRAAPKARLQPEHILIDDHDVVTAGGLMAWLDLGLFIVGSWFGPDMVTRLARHLLVDPAGRSQRHYSSFRPRRRHGEPHILAAQRQIDACFSQTLTVSDLATSAGMSERTFLRRFHAATGYSPGAYLQMLRIEKARGRLERGGESTAATAWAVGYGDVSAFSRTFRQVTGLTPGAYRTRFCVGGPDQKGRSPLPGAATAPITPSNAS